MRGAAATVDEVLALYERWGHHRYDEEVAQADHARQTAARAAGDGAGEALVAAALLHDVGHLLVLAGEAPDPHERSGPAFLGALFPLAVTAPIALHVEAKRYLCAVDPGYAGRLSAGSQRSLRRQGGPLAPSDVAVFEATSGWDDAVALRRWDDDGKVIGAPVPPLAAYEELLCSLARCGS
jgi:predicted HD phosphohydrolase